jgi:hypothetical protein
VNATGTVTTIEALQKAVKKVNKSPDTTSEKILAMHRAMQEELKTTNQAMREEQTAMRDEQTIALKAIGTANALNTVQRAHGAQAQQTRKV